MFPIVRHGLVELFPPGKAQVALTISVLFSLTLALCFAQPPDTDREAVRINRIFAAGQLWGTIRHFHPYLAYRDDIDWDKALVTALQRINGTTPDAEYAAIITDMLQTIGDPVTRLLSRVEQAGPAPTAPELFRSTEDGILIVSLRDYVALGGDEIGKKLSSLAKNLADVRGVLIDLRPLASVSRSQMQPIAGPPWSRLSILSDTGFASALTTQPLFTPSTRRLMYTGYTDPFPNVARIAFQVISGGRIASGRSRDIPIVFLADSRSAIPPEAVALQTAGKSAIIAVGGATDDSLVDVHTMNLPGALKAQMRLAELVTEAGAITFHPDLVIPTSESDSAVVERALALVRNFARQPHTDNLSAIVRSVRQEEYSDMRFPTREYRLLAAFRIWSVIHFFFPAKSLTGEDWESVVRQAIPAFERARDASEYAIAVAELVHHLHDSHGLVTAPEIDERLGAKPALKLEFVERRPVITAIRNADIQRQFGIEIGDEVTAVDGVEADSRIGFWSKIVSASTPQFELFEIANLLLAGREGSAVEVTIRKRNGRMNRASLQRTEKYPGFGVWIGGLFHGEEQRSGSVYKILPGDIGYADLDRLDDAKVSEMFALFRNTKGIVFDMRGYPHHSPWSILERLNNKQNIPAAIAEDWWVHSPTGPNGVTRRQAMQYVDVGAGDYRGKTVVLIDGRAVSQAEHLALYLKAVGATLVGSATAGADCFQTSFAVPGGIRVNFSAALVREPNGRLIQRAGLLPDVQVEPTIKGIREGRDEVLDRAIEVVTKSVR
jgi:C-terminal processing protease CtpA/Prc